MKAAAPPALAPCGLKHVVERPASVPLRTVEIDGQGQRIFLLFRTELMQRFAAVKKETSRA